MTHSKPPTRFWPISRTEPIRDCVQTPFPRRGSLICPALKHRAEIGFNCGYDVSSKQNRHHTTDCGRQEVWFLSWGVRLVTLTSLAWSSGFIGVRSIGFEAFSQNTLFASSFIESKERIAYVDNWQIYVMDSDGTHTSCLTCHRTLAQATAPAWSPDGKYIAFKAMGDQNSWAIAVIGVDGSNLRKIADYDSGNSDISEDPPAWSPDGKKIAYATYRSDQWGIFINDVDGFNEQRLTYNNDWITLPKWSPDGKKIAFRSFNGLVVIYPDRLGPAPQLYAEGKDVSSLAWAPDSTRITYTTNDGLFVINAAGTNLHRLADWGDSPIWSPDGMQIAFISIPKQNCGCWGIELIDPDGSNQRLLYHPEGIVDDPVWSPYSTRLLFMANPDKLNDSWYNSDIYMINFDGSQLRHIVKGWSPAWSP